MEIPQKQKPSSWGSKCLRQTAEQVCEGQGELASTLAFTVAGLSQGDLVSGSIIPIAEFKPLILRSYESTY